jgi:hypothetical protein
MEDTAAIVFADRDGLSIDVAMNDPESSFVRNSLTTT